MTGPVMEWIARILGFLYLLGAVAVMQKARLNSILDMGLAKITLKPTPRHERIIGASMFLQAALLALSGGLLLFLSRWAVIAFVVCWAAQGLYLVWHNRLPDSEKARPTPAFTLFGIATLAVIAWGWTGVLR